MSRSGYSDDLDTWTRIKWRGQVASVIRGKHGQAFLRELIAALEAMPVKRLISGALQTEAGEVCALGALGVHRKIDLTDVDTYDYDELAETFGIRHQLIQEIEFENDENCFGRTPEQRWQDMHEWALQQLKP